MRIIGGALSGRRLIAEPAPATRPTSDRVREALASALQARGLIADARVLDLFAGTGALGFEALSRGAQTVVAVDRDRRACACIAKNAEALSLQDRVQVLALDPLASPAKLATALTRTGATSFTLVFVDPPYALANAAAEMVGELAARALLAPGAIVVVEHATKEPPPRPVCFSELAAYTYGDTGIRLWETIATPTQPS